METSSGSVCSHSQIMVSVTQPPSVPFPLACLARRQGRPSSSSMVSSTAAERLQSTLAGTGTGGTPGDPGPDPRGAGEGETGEAAAGTGVALEPPGSVVG